MIKKGIEKLSTTQIIMLSFLVLIVIGSILLALPVSSATGSAVSYIDALFTATTSVCVTGLVTVTTATTWSVFGQIVILLLIQIGGLGVITIISAVMIELHKKMGLNDRLLIQAAFNLNTMSGLVAFVKKVMFGTFLVEGIGALLYMLVFIPDYGPKGIWLSVFNSISAFCNAGIDILGENSLCDYALNPIVNITSCLLITIGGIGFVVWWDLIRVIKNFRKQGFKCFQNLTLHSKIAISVSLTLILVGAAAFFAFEYNNPLTMKDCSVGEKIMLSLFQSVTTRTAGFATIPQQNFSNASSIVSLMLMFIGGSPCGTAGGVKTVTMAVLFGSVFASVKNEKNVTFFNRNIPKETINKAVSVTGISFLTAFISTILLSAVTDASVIDVLYETVSATATVGLTRNLTPSLNALGKTVIILTMYLGRVGPISLAIAFRTKREKQNIIENPTEEIVVG